MILLSAVSPAIQTGCRLGRRLCCRGQAVIHWAGKTVNALPASPVAVCGRTLRPTVATVVFSFRMMMRAVMVRLQPTDDRPVSVRNADQRCIMKPTKYPSGAAPTAVRNTELPSSARQMPQLCVSGKRGRYDTKKEPASKCKVYGGGLDFKWN